MPTSSARPDAEEPYANNSDNTLTLGGNGASGINGFSLPVGSRNIRLTFRHWYALETHFDGAALQYSTTAYDHGYVYIPDQASDHGPYIASGGYDDVISGFRRWTGFHSPPNGSLEPVVVNLDALAGSTVWLGWHFTSDYIIDYEGYYLDDVSLAYDSAASCATAGGPAASYVVSGDDGTAVAGQALTLTLTAKDRDGFTSFDYTGTATFSSSDSQAHLPMNATFVSGTASGVSVTFGTPGMQSLTARDSADSTISAVHNVLVSAGPPRKLRFDTQPLSTNAGASIGTIRVQLLDSFGNISTASGSTVTLSLAPGAEGVAIHGTTTVNAVSGVATFSGLSINRTGTGYRIVASSSGVESATSSAFDISAGGASRYELTGLPSSTGQGSPITFSITARDPNENAASSYSGTASLTSTDPAAVLPAAVTFNAGVVTSVEVKLSTAGTQTITVTDRANPSITGSASVTVNAPDTQHKSSGCGCTTTGPDASWFAVLASLGAFVRRRRR